MPPAFDIMSTSGAATPLLGGVDGVSGGGWLEPAHSAAQLAQLKEATVANQTTGGAAAGGGGGGGGAGGPETQAMRSTPLPVLLLQCALPADGGEAGGAEGGEEEGGETEDRVGAHAWRVDTAHEEPKEAQLTALEASLKAKKDAASAAGDGDAGQGGSGEGSGAGGSSRQRAMPEVVPCSVPVYLGGDRRDVVLQAEWQALVVQGHSWPLANPAVLLQGE